MNDKISNNDACDIVILRTGFFDDSQIVIDALNNQSKYRCTIVDVRNIEHIHFDDSCWDDVVRTLLSSAKVITI